MSSDSLLTALDIMNSFPFQKLPPELRNRMYRELLAGPPNKFSKYGWPPARLYPAILSTSRVISKEATGILYGENIINCHLSDDDRTFYFHGVKYFFDRLKEDGYLPALRRVTGLQIWVEYPKDTKIYDRGQESDSIRWVVRHFSEWLSHGHSLQSLRICLNLGGQPVADGHDYNPEMDETVLEQFTMLRGIKEVNVTGTVTAEYASRLESLVSGRSPVVDTWKQLSLLSNCLDMYREISQPHVPAKIDLRFRTAFPGWPCRYPHGLERLRFVWNDYERAREAMKRGDVEGFVMAKKLVQHRLRRDYRKIIDNTKSIEQSWKDMMEFEEVDGKLMEDGKAQ